jgi:predicted MPP superfamily phosphohydrolase
MKDSTTRGKRFSDKGIFWLGAAALIFFAHLHLYLAVGIHLTCFFVTAWIAVGASALASSYFVSRISCVRCKAWKMLFLMFLQKWGACWNIFVLLSSFLMFASRVVLNFYPASVKAMFGFSCALALAICLYGFMEARVVRVVRIEIRTNKIPGRGRLRILHLSDLHIGPFMYASFIKKIVRASLREKPDLTVVTGDTVDGCVGDERGTFPFYVRFSNYIREIAGTSRLGIWAVPGNHDYYEGFDNSAAFMRLSGIKILRTRHIDLGRIVLAGADDLDHEIPSGEPGTSRSEALMASLSEDERKKFVILLRHRPKIEAVTVGQFDLQLSGHTHGGQLFSLPSSRHKIPGRPKGLLALGRGSSLYVTNGTGFVGPPMRFFAPAEIVVFELIGK